MSTSSLEHIAEDLIAHALQRNKILVAKPKFDHDGADLFALLDVSDGAKFCRIQCKGRSLLSSAKSQIEIPVKYVTDAFIVILFIEDKQILEQNLFCFFGTQIRKWKKSKKNKYTLYFSKSNYREKLKNNVFSQKSVDEIIKSIINVNVKGEFKTMGHAYANLRLPVLTLEASMTNEGTTVQEE